MLLHNKLLIGTGLLLAAFLGCLVLVDSVQYRPYGVPESRLAEYEQRVQQINRYNERVDAFEGTPKPIAQISITKHDFGFVDLTQTLEHHFELKNVGLEDLLLTKIKEYANASVSFDNERITPGTLGQFKIRWNPVLSEDTIEQKVIIGTNDPLHPELEVTVSVKRRQDLLMPEAVSMQPAQMGERATGYFEIRTQTDGPLKINEVTCDLPEFVWTAEPLNANDPTRRHEATAAGYKVMVSGLPSKYGKFSREVHIEMLKGDQSERRALTLRGRVKTPITFNHPDMNKTQGLDIGTIGSEKQTTINIQVRLRGEEHRSLAVLDQFPKVLKVDLKPTGNLKGVYKLQVTIEPGTPTTQFNRADQRGYVSIGDPMDPEFSNWLPIYGAIASPE